MHHFRKHLDDGFVLWESFRNLNLNKERALRCTDIEWNSVLLVVLGCVYQFGLGVEMC